MMYQKWLLFIGFLSLSFPTYSQSPQDSIPPEENREFRAAWVATVANISWPSKPGLPVDQQKKEAVQILDSLQKLHFNAVIFQVRPQADALYDSKYEPWSYYLTGSQGKAPSPYYDPLQYWITEAHKRAMELHVWLNPYRAHHTTAPKPEMHSVIRQFPEETVKLEEGYWWFIPTSQNVQRHTLAVIKDILVKYDIDGVHFDDYFYPYAAYNKGKGFPDDKFYQQYLKEGGLLSKGDWRRAAVNYMVRETYYLIKSYKPHIKFGISPFGIWKPGHPKSIKGFNQYEELYADAKLWLNNGWVDYFSPQLYWTIHQTDQSYPILLQWWQEQNTHQRFLWPGINIHNMTNDDRGGDELQSQIMINRAIANKAPGIIHWSVNALLGKDKLRQRLLRSVYKEPALVPALSETAANRLEKPDVSYEQKNISGQKNIAFHWSMPSYHQANFTLIQYQLGKDWHTEITGENSFQIPAEKDNKPLKRVVFSLVDRNGNTGAPKTIRL